MPKINLVPILKSITIALVFFILGRFLTIQMGESGLWVTIGLLLVFYTAWWALNRRNK